jgi:hypothetical protein
MGLRWRVPRTRHGDQAGRDPLGDGDIGARETRSGRVRSHNADPHALTIGGFALSAWFVDPGGNTIGLLQFKDQGRA